VPPGLDARSLAPVIEGRQPKVRDCLFTAYRNCQRSIRDDRWKLIRYPLIDKTQLFDLQADPHEMTDLAGKPVHRPLDGAGQRRRLPHSLLLVINSKENLPGSNRKRRERAWCLAPVFTRWPPWHNPIHTRVLRSPRSSQQGQPNTHQLGQQQPWGQSLAAQYGDPNSMVTHRLSAIDQALGRGPQGASPTMQQHHIVARLMPEKVAEKVAKGIAAIKILTEKTLIGAENVHTHVRNVYRWDGTPPKAEQGVPVFNGEKSAHFASPKQAFCYFHLCDGAMTVREFATPCPFWPMTTPSPGISTR
jgi:N-sulfoglucosamine sulfohydrolase-like protein